MLSIQGFLQEVEPDVIFSLEGAPPPHPPYQQPASLMAPLSAQPPHRDSLAL